MGLLGTLLDSTKSYEVSFTVKGDMNEIRQFIIKRCTEKGYNFICNKEDAWLGDLEVKRGRVDKNIIDNYHFNYSISFGNNAGTMYAFDGMIVPNSNAVTIKIFCLTEHARSWCKVVQDSIVNKFGQL